VARATRPRVAVAESSSTMLPPPAIYKASVTASVSKASMTPVKVLTLGFMAGAYIGLGACLATKVGGPVAAFVGLPFGLTWVVCTGSELVTGNVFTMTSGLLSGKISARHWVSNIALSGIANFVGAIAVCFGALRFAGLAANPSFVATATAMASAKLAPFTVLFAKAVFCNWLVCLAVWLANGAQSLPGKAVGIFITIGAFVTLGFEHLVANFFIVPSGILAGHQASTWTNFAQGLVPVALGNLVGGALFALVSYISYGAAAESVSPAMAITKAEEKTSRPLVTTSARV